MPQILFILFISCIFRAISVFCLFCIFFQAKHRPKKKIYTVKTQLNTGQFMVCFGESATGGPICLLI